MKHEKDTQECESVKVEKFESQRLLLVISE